MNIIKMVFRFATVRIEEIWIIEGLQFANDSWKGQEKLLDGAFTLKSSEVLSPNTLQ